MRYSAMKGFFAALTLCAAVWAEDFPKPYSPPRTARENVFAFTEKPTARYIGNDIYEVTFAVKGYCDVTIGIIDSRGRVIRHLAAGVLGRNAPPPLQKNSLKQRVRWNGKDDFSHYPKEPGKLRVRVMLGLKPVFDKRLGGRSPKNIPGYVWGLAVGPRAAYVFTKGNGSHGHVGCRKFDRDGRYLMSLIPAPANLPEAKRAGMEYIEYEPGKRAPHGASLNETVSRDAFVLPGNVNGKGVGDQQPALSGNRIYFCNAGAGLLVGRANKSKIHYIHTDGSTDRRGILGMPFIGGLHLRPRLAASNDGKWIYMLGLGERGNAPVVFRYAVGGKKGATPFLGNLFKNRRGRVSWKPGSDNKSFNNPLGLACDARGRIYVSDERNGRVQIFSPAGKYLKTLKVERPSLLFVHKKTGALYVFHVVRVAGRSRARLTKFSAFPALKEEFHQDGLFAAVAALDSWSSKPRLWTAGSSATVNTGGSFGKGPSVRVFEERGKKLVKIDDFDEDAKKEAGPNYLGRWSGVGAVGSRVNCDPTREQVYYRLRTVFDLKTGRLLGHARVNATNYDDIVFDKHGYLHVHFNPGFYMPGVGRVDPSRAPLDPTGKDARKTVTYPEVPYDYGVEKTGKYRTLWRGVLPVMDQLGAKYFQDGIGVNMRGDVAEECNIYYVPKMEKGGYALAAAGFAARKARGEYFDPAGRSYAGYMKRILEKQKRGERVYSIRRVPGSPLAGGTIWTFDWTGELRQECAVTAGGFLNGSLIDEDGFLYFTNSRPKIVNGKPFLDGKGGRYGDPKFKATPFTGTYIKTRGKAMILMAKSPIQLTPLPSRPPNLSDTGGFPLPVGSIGMRCWIEGAEWLYAGASPIVAGGCSCPTQRPYLDWYKRSFVPEAYRHSIGVLDTNGNLIMHLGRYGNFDSTSGPKSKIPVGGDGIGMHVARFISGTDNYLVYDVWGEQLVVLKLNYHAEATVPIKMH